MAKSFREYYNRLPETDKSEIEDRVKRELEAMPLAALRKARNTTQQKLAEELNVSQASISKMENQTDMYISTARRYIEALGGTLQVVASFPNGKIALQNFGEIEAE
ncbi:MAG: XRE family transcriptional regulator [Candidatus Electrothrix sp. LOE2]|jgi:transcriptional regulator with XRE-family HTH domain|nr:XRE family transcriptional regulator [Candidatus Electrothrix sp. LOE2]